MGLGIRTASRQAFRSALFAMGFHVVEQTKTADLLRLMKTLKPVDCGIDLIRFGGGGDGGYLIPDDLRGVEYCFSPGVNTVSDFENQLADLNIKSFLADASVESPPILRPEFVFDKRFLGGFDRENYFSLESWKNKYIKDYAGDLILQMDIEGAEYEVILGTPETLLDQFRILVIEFHALDRLFDAFVFNLFSSCFEKLLKSFHVVHIHPDNSGECVKRGGIEIPVMMEFTFLSKRRTHSVRPQEKFPHELDADNSKTARYLPLPKCWYTLT